MRCFFTSLLVAMVFTFVEIHAQTNPFTVTVVHQPCSFDGELIVSINSGMTPPLTFVYGNEYTHEYVNSLTDTATGLNYFNQIIVYDSYGNYATIPTTFTKPFYISRNVVNAVCPETMGTVDFSTNTGEATQVDYYFPNGDYYGSGNPMQLPVGEYWTIVTDENGCNSGIPEYSGGWDDTLYFVHMHQSSGMGVYATSTNAGCTNGSILIDSISGGIAPYVYQWSTGVTGIIVENLSMGNYNCSITDAQGCQHVYRDYIYQDSDIGLHFITEPATCTQLNGSITAFGSGGLPPYSYLFWTGETTQTINGVSGESGGYVTVTDANGCFDVEYAYLQSSSPITVTYTSTISDCDADNGAISLNISNGIEPYEILWNTVPPQTGSLISNLPEGSYSFIVTDSVNCIKTGSVAVSGHYSLVKIISTQCICPNVLGSASIQVYGSYPPYSFNWSNGETSQNISNLTEGTYTCTVTDLYGCTIAKSCHINSISPIHLNHSVLNVSGPTENDGRITLTVSGGIPPFSYIWSDGQTGTIASGLSPGYYSVTVTDASGCTAERFSWLGYNQTNPSPHCVVTGKAFVDQNNNCIYDIGEMPLKNIPIKCSVHGTKYTDQNGEYIFHLSSGNYTVSEVVQYYYPLALCQNQYYNIDIIAESGCLETYNFAHQIDTIHDIETQINPVNLMIAGELYSQRVTIFNAGTHIEENIQLSYLHDNQLWFVNSSPISFIQNDPDEIPEWLIPSLAVPTLEPGQGMQFYLNFNVPGNIPFNTLVNFSDTVAYTNPMSNYLDDYSPWNNISNFEDAVYNPFGSSKNNTTPILDPIRVEVVPKGNGSAGYITHEDSILYYTIYFKNTELFSLNQVVIIDTLDENLDWTSLKPGYSTHSYTMALSDQGILFFTFKDINLPPNGMASFGSVSFSIKQKRHLPFGSRIQNCAKVLFNNQQPLITNKTTNTIKNPEGIDDQLTHKHFVVYPNPTSGKFSVEGDKLQMIYLYNSLIQPLFTTIETDNISLDAYPDGLYYLKIVTTNNSYIIKLIKQH